MAAELIEPDENLIRCPLTPAQEASAIFRRKQICEALRSETKHGGDQHTRAVDNLSSPAERCAAAASEATGKDERAVRRADDLEAVAGPSLDKGDELDALAKMQPQERKSIIQRERVGRSAACDRERCKKLPSCWEV